MYSFRNGLSFGQQFSFQLNSNSIFLSKSKTRDSSFICKHIPFRLVNNRHEMHVLFCCVVKSSVNKRFCQRRNRKENRVNSYRVKK